MSEKFHEKIFEANRLWATAKTFEDPDFFKRLATQQAPDYLWIGCSDARVPANEIVKMAPGELFVHRNVANLVHRIDLNLLSVLEFAVNDLKIKHIIVCGHYGCGGVRAAMNRREVGQVIDHWLAPVKDIYADNAELLDREPNEEKRLNMLCELNVRQQVLNICRTKVIQSAWNAGRSLSVHGWIYSIHDGLLHDLDFWIDGASDLDPAYRMPSFAHTPDR